MAAEKRGRIRAFDATTFDQSPNVEGISAVKRNRMYACLSIVAVALVLVVSQSAMSGESKERFEAELSSLDNGIDPLVSGTARSESRGSRLKFNVEVEDIGSVGEGGILQVVVGGGLVGSMTVAKNPDGILVGRIDLDTVDGDVVPGPFGDGVDVEIQLADGTPILAGSFSSK